ncbi:rubrerythrin family protein [uncultured Peptoniphilus sp.]|uniref:rubrerythrin family protein n=1 Tax=uncultured Peptoniphilus sp. TaxID=254354 RepID=UPI002582D977|nr:ferritin family protein [uncultured Peptoniphilus sp.]MDU6783050.1 ferritin family protein [Peptoniphilus harei]
MNQMTSDNLRSAFGGESQARTRYNIWGDVAEKDGFKNVKRLFDATSDAEKIHATLHFKALKDVSGDFAVTSMAGFGINSTSDNLEAAKNGEIFESTQMYPSFIAVAEMQGEKEAVRAMKFASAAEKVHAERYQEAKDSVDAGKDLDVEKIYVCPTCGYITFEEEDKCPICGCPGNKFMEY